MPRLKQPHARLSVTRLEDRVTPAVQYVVPIEGVDRVTRFPDLQSAADASSDGDTIQIEPGSDPGSVDLVASVTVQGDPAYGGAAGLRAAGTVVPIVHVAGLNQVFSNLALGMVEIAPLATGTTIANSIVLGGTVTVGDDTVSLGVYAESTSLAVTGSTSGATTLTGNTFVGPRAGVRLGNTAGETGGPAAGDVVSNNSFSGQAYLPSLQVTNETGLTVTGNRMLAGAGPAVILTECSGTFSNNTIRSSGSISGGILIDDASGTDARPTDLTVSGNRIAVSGQGVRIFRESVLDPFAVRVTGNALAGSTGGVVVTGNNSNSPFGTLQITGNDLRGYAGRVGGNGYAIAAYNNPPSPPIPSTIDAPRNLFTPSDPQTAVNSYPTVTVDTANPLTGGAANLTAMFLTLGAGPPTAAQHAASDAAPAAQQAQAAVRSPQAAGAVVDGLFVALLHRPPTAGERTTFVNAIAGGTTLELVLAALLSGPEYYGEVTQGSPNPDGAWVQSLYVSLLGRQGSGAEISSWIGGLRGGLSKGQVAMMIAQSPEFRGDQVRSYYGPGLSAVIPAPDVLKRQTPPTAAEVAGWANASLDLFAVQVALLSSGEFQTFG